jgi:glycosyltransferase involved in cell wall biosynthesis
MKVSVVIPVYNAARYIKGCIDSLRQQTMDDFEAILVDDHGTDNSIEIASEYVRQLNDTRRFRIIRTAQNSGPGVARNVGIQAARGEYVAFMDSDDEIDPKMLQLMTQRADAYQADICYCQLRYVGGNRDGEVFRNPILPDGDFSNDLKCAFLTRFTTFCWSFIYRRRLLMDNALSFPPERSSEDTNFLVKVLLVAQRVAVVNKPLYYYFQREDSLTTHCNPTRYRTKLSAMDSLLSEVRTRGWYNKFAPELDYLYLKKGYAVACLNYLRSAEQPEVDVLKRMSDQLDQSVSDWQGNFYRHHTPKIALLTAVLYNHPNWAVRWFPKLLAKTKVAL